MQMFAGIYRDFEGKSECGDFKFTGIACIPAIPVIFEVNKKKVGTFYIYSLLLFFKFPYNLCRDFRRTCDPRDNYMHFTGYVLRHGDPPHFLWGKNLQCTIFYETDVIIVQFLTQIHWPYYNQGANYIYQVDLSPPRFLTSRHTCTRLRHIWNLNKAVFQTLSVDSQWAIRLL